MPKIILFAILWGLFWDAEIFGFMGLYLVPLLVSAAFLSYSPLIVKSVNIIVAGIILWLLMFLWAFSASGFTMLSGNLLTHITAYALISLAFISFIYVLEKK